MNGFNQNKLNIGAYILQPYARSEKHIQQIKEADIDFIVSMDSDIPTLDIFQKYGLGAIVNDVFPRWWGASGENSGRMCEINPVTKYEEAVKNFADHSAIWGIDIGDELSSMDFEHCKNICSCCSGLPADKLIYTNLYANYASVATTTLEERKKQWGCNTYEEYVRAYCEKVPLDYICFDHYLYSSENLTQFFNNFTCASDMADKYNKKLWFVGQISSSVMQKSITANQLRFQAYCAMAFGARVIMWACYTGGWWHNHALDANGDKTAQYENLKTVNAEISACAKEYMKYRRIGTCVLDNFKSPNAPDFYPAMLANVTAASDRRLIVSKMVAKDGTDHEALFVVAAGDYTDENPYIEKISFQSLAKNIKVFIGSAQAAPQYDCTTGLYSIEIPSNHGALITANS